ncbi:SGNH/GDSL hydrolase family protein [Lacticaseibacillus yichunensis]|uniref:SGNH/GDSL hydrolase family protein n=2 Tax=Bacilli TaxID=91061 RepID=A0ABW4CPM1_9LACO|nr:SGNH/GDSL hydrolase family protein [Lacticaseibacillus yichunensis]
MTELKDLPGNAAQFLPENAEKHLGTSLEGAPIAFLGSSITLGAGSLDRSYVDFLAAQYGVEAVKSAVNGTTLADADDASYIARLKRDIPTAQHFAALVVQLSTNDGRRGCPVGAIADGSSADAFDPHTTIGAIEFILAYAKAHWDCPVLFYTCLRDPAETDYTELVEKLIALQAKWHFAILDLHGDAAVAEETAAQPASMLDDAHPTMMGYRDIWTPRFAAALETLLK